ncbi:Intracellular exo-alpha-L-arabinofuranosidase 2 [compost metagenome]
MCNVDTAKDAEVEIELRGLVGQNFAVTGTVLEANEMDAHNTFQQPDKVKPSEFTGFTLEGTTLKVKLSPMSVTVLELK